MNTLIVPRNMGKTTALIKMSAATGDYIVTKNFDTADGIRKAAIEMGLRIPLPITYNCFLERDYSIRISGFLFDDADIFLQSISIVPINVITVSN